MFNHHIHNTRQLHCFTQLRVQPTPPITVLTTTVSKRALLIHSLIQPVTPFLYVKSATGLTTKHFENNSKAAVTVGRSCLSTRSITTEIYL